jgi:hypothetical protein
MRLNVNPGTGIIPDLMCFKDMRPATLVIHQLESSVLLVQHSVRTSMVE